MNTRICVLSSAIALLFASSAYAEQIGVGAIEVSDKIISVSGSGHHRTFPCNGRKLEVTGVGHVISTTGECSYVEVAGADSAVDVTIAPKGTLEVAGANHKIRWKAAGEIKQDISGVDHKIVRVK
jgi:hypothetical protein